MIRARSEVVYDPPAARKVAAEAIEEAFWRKNDPADLINVALEWLVEGSFELPVFRTLNDLAADIRSKVNGTVDRDDRVRGVGGHEGAGSLDELHAGDRQAFGDELLYPRGRPRE